VALCKKFGKNVKIIFGNRFFPNGKNGVFLPGDNIFFPSGKPGK